MLLKKISVKTVFGDKGEILETVMKDKKTQHKLIRVVGIATSLQHGKSKFEEKQEGDEDRKWTAFIGRFEATNLITGEIFNSPKCFLPEFAADIVAGQFTGGEDVQSVSFAFDIGAHYSADAITSYEYDIDPLTEFESPDLDALSKAIGKKSPAQIEDKTAKK